MANTFAVTGDLTVAGATTKQGSLTRVNGAASVLHDLVIATTTDATPTTVATLPVPASGCVTVTVIPQGVQSDGSNGFEQGPTTNSARRNGAGAPALSQGAAGSISVTLENTFAITRPSFAFVISGNNLLLQVTGKAATTINWSVEYRAVTR